MVEKKARKESDKRVLARVRKEMAEPRIASSARRRTLNQYAPKGRAGSQ